MPNNDWEEEDKDCKLEGNDYEQWIRAYLWRSCILLDGTGMESVTGYFFIIILFFIVRILLLFIYYSSIDFNASNVKDAEPESILKDNKSTTGETRTGHLMEQVIQTLNPVEESSTDNKLFELHFGIKW